MNSHLEERDFQEILDGGYLNPTATEHLQSCETCRAKLEEYQIIFAAVSIEREQITYDLQMDVINEIRRRKRKRTIFLQFSIAALLLASFLSGWILIRRLDENILFSSEVSQRDVDVFLIVCCIVGFVAFSCLNQLINRKKDQSFFIRL